MSDPVQLEDDEQEKDLPSGADETHVDAALASITEESRRHWTPAPKRMDHAVDAERRLFARIDAAEKADQKAAPRRGGFGGDASFWRPVALVTAVAAGFVFFARPHTEGPSAGNDRDSDPRVAKGALSVPNEAPRPTAPAEFAAVTGGGELRVDGAAVNVRAVALRDAQKVEAHGGDAVFSAPGRASWLLEKGTVVSTVRAGTQGGAIILALSVGAVEAQVTPVPGGEAFAVDVDGVRVAVHGTHLRVARADRGGDRVIVDLTEGTILVGTPPKAGATVSSTQIVAPAHVEFSVADVERTLTTDHVPSHVRTPVDPLSLIESAIASPTTPSTLLPAEEPSPVHSAGLPTSTGARAPTAASPKTPTESEMVYARVRACSDLVKPAGTGATTTVHSVLTVVVKADGTTEVANFVPPIQAEVQKCVTDDLWGKRWSEPGEHKFPVEVRK